MAVGIPFLLNWTLTQFAAVLALALTAALKSNLRVIYLAGAVGCGSIATYSSANGMLIWPVILIAGLVASISRRYMFVIAVAGITNIGLYFVGYRISHELDIGNLTNHPIYLLGFLASYVSMPFGALKVGSFGVWVGIVHLLIFLYLLYVSVRTRLLSSVPAIVLFGYFVFTLFTALLTAAGRMNSSDMTFTAAKASRYLTVPLANWGALLIALVWLGGRRGWRLVSPRSILLLSAGLLFLTFPKFGPWLYGNDLVFAQQQWAAISVENGLFDPKIARYLYPDPPFIAPFLQRLRNDHLSIFYKGYSLSLGQPFTSRFPLPSARGRLGVVTDTVPVLGGLEVVGWTDANRPERFVFVDQSSRIVGLGRRLPAGFPLNLSSNAPPSLAWVGFMNLSFASKSFSTYSFGPHEASPTLIAGPSPVTPFALGPVHASQTAVQR